MKRNITKFLAALALLVFMMPSLVAWGQNAAVGTTLWAEDFSGFANNSDPSGFYTDSHEGTTVYGGVTLTYSKKDGGSTTQTYTSGGPNSNSNLLISKTGGSFTVSGISTGNATELTVTYAKSGSGTITISSSTSGVTISGSDSGATITINGASTIDITFTNSSSSNLRFDDGCVTVKTAGGTPVETVATPTFSVAEGTYTSAQTVSINCETSGATIYYTTDGSTPTTGSSVYSSSLTISETTTLKAMAAKSGMNNSSVATAVYTINLPYSGPDYVRVTDITALTDGMTVIIAARYNSTATSYYAMTAATTGKPTGVSFTSTTSSNGEILPATIVNEESTYKWTVGVSGNEYTFTNSSNQVLGYSSGTNFATGGNNTAWTITRTTSGSSAMVGGYEGYYIVNKNQNGRGIALNNQYNYGPYATSNNNSGDYNFYLDIFVKGYTPASVATPTFSLAEGTYYEAQNVTINCETQNANIYYTIDGSTPDVNSTPYTGSISVTATTTIKAIAYYGGANSNVATATYTIVPPLSTIAQIYTRATEVGNTATTVRIAFNNWVVTGANSSSHAFVSDGTNGFMIYGSGHGFSAGDVLSGTVECKVQLYYGAIEITELTSETSGLTVTPGGTVTVADIAMANLAGINTGALVSYQNLTCEAREEGNYTNYYLSDGTTEIQAYKTLLNNYADYLEGGKTYNITGVFVLNNSTKRINPRSADDIVEVEVQHEEYTLTIGNPDHITITANYNEVELTNGQNAQVLDGTEVSFSVIVSSGFVLDEVTVVDANQAAVLFTGTSGVYTFIMPASNVTINATATESSVTPITGDKYVKVTSTADLTSGQYLIVYENGNVAFDGSLETLDAASNTISVTVSNNEIAVTTTTAASEFTINPTNGTILSASGYYIGQTSDANGMKTSATEAYTNTISIDQDGNAVVLASGGAYLRYNATSGQERFRYFKSSSYTGQKAIQLYKKVNTYTLTVNGYTEGSTGGYVLVASPVSTTPTAAGMITTTSNYDLYYYDDSQDKEWINYKNQDGSVNQNFGGLTPGKGFLYANSADVTLTFTGTPYSGEGEIDVIAGWNLIGNPFGNEASLNAPFYRMNEDGTGLSAEIESGSTVDAMEGVFVNATEAGNVTFSAASAKSASVALNVTRNRGNVIDRAIVRFDEGQQLPKFQLFENSTKLYIPQGNEDFAVVRSANEGEMPVSFKASENGTYTLAVETENMEMDYLHLIDNMTGMDVDLLQTPSYTFEASTRDHANRFRLVFKGNNANEQTTETFAYFNGTSWTVSNLGEATLQVVDVMGRLVSTEQINGNATINLNETPGIYMLRLVNGNDVKVQKVVVR